MISSLTRITRFGFPNSFVSCEKVCESLLVDPIHPGGLRVSDNTLLERSVDVAASIERNLSREGGGLNKVTKQEMRDSIFRCMINSRFSVERICF